LLIPVEFRSIVAADVQRKEIVTKLCYAMELLPLADRYSGQERKAVAYVFGNYADALRKENSSPEISRILAAKATEMGFESKP